MPKKQMDTKLSNLERTNEILISQIRITNNEYKQACAERDELEIIVHYLESKLSGK